MKTNSIKLLREKAIQEAQTELDKVFKKYAILISEEIATQIPVGCSIISGNGECFMKNKTGAFISNESYDYIASFQYPIDKNELNTNIVLPHIIKGKKCNILYYQVNTFNVMMGQSQSKVHVADYSEPIYAKQTVDILVKSLKSNGYKGNVVSCDENNEFTFISKF